MDDLKLELIMKLRTENLRLRSVLEECEEYFDGRADISDETNDDGSPLPNKEMILRSMIDEALS